MKEITKAAVPGRRRIQNLIYSEKTPGSLRSITYISGATAGSEVVKFNGANAIIMIANGSSTATQIKAKWDAYPGISEIGTCTTVGTASTVQYVGSGILMAGGTPAVKAERALGACLWKAKTAGASGNNIRVKYQAGTAGIFAHGDETVSLNGTDVLATVHPSGSLLTNMVAAVAASGTVAAVVDLVYNPNCPSGSEINQTTSFAPDWTALMGGIDNQTATANIQQLMISGMAYDAALSGTIIDLIPGGTAGSEVVDTSASGHLSLTIEEGVTTPAHAKTALELDSTFNTFYKAAIHGSNALWSANAVEPSGYTVETVASKTYFQDSQSQPLASSFTEYDFGFEANNIVITNQETSGTDILEFSFNGTTKVGEVVPTQSLTLNNFIANRIYLRYANSAPEYSINVW